jgi:hypothetical protein
MDARRLALFLFVYVTLDFANPLMPGAVRLDGGSVDAVHAERARPLAPSVPVAFIPTPEIVVDGALHVQARRRPDPMSEPCTRTVTRTRHTPPSSSDPTGPSEDH